MKNINFAADSIQMYQFFKSHIKKQEDGTLYCDGSYIMEQMPCESVNFDIQHTYEIFDFIGNYWGGWNGCPEHDKMREIAKRWDENYSLEICELRYDTIVFACKRKLETSEIEQIAMGVVEISHDGFDHYDDELAYIKESIEENNNFTIWWD